MNGRCSRRRTSVMLWIRGCAARKSNRATTGCNLGETLGQHGPNVNGVRQEIVVSWQKPQWHLARPLGRLPRSPILTPDSAQASPPTRRASARLDADGYSLLPPSHAYRHSRSPRISSSNLLVSSKVAPSRRILIASFSPRMTVDMASVRGMP